VVLQKPAGAGAEQLQVQNNYLVFFRNLLKVQNNYLVFFRMDKS
jgi:hypothetical protein